MAGFVGRRAQLLTLNQSLQRVTTSPDKPGETLFIRGRRRIGKSRLVQEFLNQAGVPYLFFTASTRTTTEELELFSQEVGLSNLPGKLVFEDTKPGTWESALRLFMSTLPTSGPAILVIDELPYLTASDPGFDGTLQKMFDGFFSDRRLLFIGIGSDLAMMEALTTHDKPFFGRAKEMVVPALSPAEVGQMLELSAADSFDAYLITGGLPLICNEWRKGDSMAQFLENSLNDQTSALIVNGERALSAEFPSPTEARDVLMAIGGTGARTFSKIIRASGKLNDAAVNRSLVALQQKRIVQSELPLSTKKSVERRYWISDPHLKFWLAFVGNHLDEVERGRADRLLERIHASWPSWRGMTIEPTIRESIARLPVDKRPHPTGVIGGFWTRTNVPEIDLVVADKSPVARSIFALGSIKWKENAPFDTRDYGDLVKHRLLLPGASDETPLIVVSRSGCSVQGVRVYDPEELISAWR